MAEFEKIQLSPTLLHTLYANSLVLLENDAIHAVKENIALPTENVIPMDEPEPNGKIVFEGGNEKQVVIIVNDERNKILEKTSIDMLLKIVKACKLSFQDIALVNIAAQQVNFTSIRNEFTPKVALFFGVDAAAVGLSFAIPPYKKFEHNQCKFLFAENLNAFKENSDEARNSKTQLWATLQEIFNLP